MATSSPPQTPSRGATEAVQLEPAIGFRPRILLTGATRYVGGPLLRALLERGTDAGALTS